MKAKRDKIISIQRIIFTIILLSVLLLLVLGEIFLPKEDPTETGKCVRIGENWTRVFSDGSREPIEVPGRCEAERGEVVRLETRIPDIDKDRWFCMRASQQDMKVYVDDELRQEYSTRESRLFGKNSVSAFVFFDVSKNEAGKTLAIELVSYNEYAGFLNEVYMGDKFDIISVFLRKSGLVLLVSVYMLIISSVAIVLGLVIRFLYKKEVAITYLGLGIFLLSLSMLSESRLRQFFLPNASIAADVGFLLTALLPYPFLCYVNRIQKYRYGKAYSILALGTLLNFICSILLQIFAGIDLGQTSVVAYVFIIEMVVLMAVTILLDIKRGYRKEYGELLYGVSFMLAAAIWETYTNLVPETPINGGIILSFGLIALLVMAGFKTAKDLLAVEKEKQVAIAAGEAKAQFIANMSHEIRTPINTIIGMNEMILRENVDESIREYALSVQNASNLLLGLINDVLDFSKIEAGKLNIIEGKYNLNKMLTDIVNGIRMKAEAKNIAFEVHLDKNLPGTLKGDEIRIRQVLNNILSNAVKYTHEGKVSLSVEGKYTEEKFELHMAVEDTGIGIKEKDIDKLFDSFKRLEEKKNRHIEGTGLGLNITRQLIELMGGKIEVSSEYGKGSCFTVQIPQIVVNEEIGEITQEVKKHIYAPKAKILVVDDNDMNLKVVNALLKRTGIQSVMAKGGTECLNLCREQRFDLILMDHMMPDLDGIETLHRLKEDKTGPNVETAVSVLTANAMEGMKEQYLEEGFQDYLSKPIVANELEAMIGKYLREELVEFTH